MKVFLRRLPADCSVEDLRRFVASVLGPRWYAPFRKDGDIGHCQLLTINQHRGGWVETHGVVDIEPTQVALSSILRLNGRKLKGSVIEVRRWFERSPRNDRRVADHGATGSHQDQRRSDRRRSDLVLHFSAGF
jgi:hypothetical protein